MFGDNLKPQKLFLCWVDFSKVPNKFLSCPMCLVSYDKLTVFFPAVHRASLCFREEMFRVGVGEVGRGVASLRLSGRGRGEEEGFKVEGEE